MAGHSHWQNIKHKKQRKDRRRGKLFSRLADQISAAVREGGKDVDFNPELRTAIEEAKEHNMPKENIERAIARGAGEGDYAREKQILEGYGPAGVAFLIRVETDNKNRTLSEIRRNFEEFNCSLGEAGCTAYIFEGSEPKFSFDVEEKDVNRVKEMIKTLEQHEDVVDVLTNANFD